MKRTALIRCLLLLLALLGGRMYAVAGKNDCTVCGLAIKEVMVFWTDKVTGEKPALCEDCSRLPDVCFLCGLPVKKDFTRLPDKRVLCGRDLKAVVLEERDGLRLAEDAKTELDRLFSRFIEFPGKVDLQWVDRVDVLQLYNIPGNDFHCPNVLGYTYRQTNAAGNYTVSLLSGLPARQVKATAAHEWAHVWIFENVSADRLKTLDGDAVEGFCELVSHQLMVSLNAQPELELIRSNGYTRGQINAFIAAERQFGFNEVVDWMKAGEDPRLRPEDLGRLRVMSLSAREAPPSVKTVLPATAAPVTSLAAAPVTSLSLRGITWSKTRPMAVINERTFLRNEEFKMRVGESNVTVRCLEIRPDAVVIQVGTTTNRQTLTLNP